MDILNARFVPPTYPLSGETLSCHGCDAAVPVELIDGKDGGDGNYTTLHCRRCYGPGWLPLHGEPADWNAEGTGPAR